MIRAQKPRRERISGKGQTCATGLETEDAGDAVGDDARALVVLERLCDGGGGGSDAAEEGEVAQKGRVEDHVGAHAHKASRGAPRLGLGSYMLNRYSRIPVSQPQE